MIFRRSANVDCLAAVDHQRVAGDVRGLVAGEEENGVGNFFRPTEPVEGSYGGGGLDLRFLIHPVGLGRPAAPAGSVDRAGADAVHPDLGPVVERHFAGQVHDGRLGRAVCGVLGAAHDAVGGGGEHDIAATSAQEVGNHGPRAVVKAVEVQLDGFIPGLVANFVDLSAG